jgi:hypothetical protein
MKETYRKPPVLCWFFHENCQFFESSQEPGTGFFQVCNLKTKGSVILKIWNWRFSHPKNPEPEIL